MTRDIGRMRVTATPGTPTDEIAELAAAPAPPGKAFEAQVAAGDPVRVTLAGGTQPSAPITLRFDLSGDPDLAGAFTGEVKPLIQSLSDNGDPAQTDLLPATWDPASKTVTAKTNHLSIFQVIATGVDRFAQAIAQVWIPPSNAASPCRNKSEATIDGVRLTLTPSKAGPVAGCLRDAGGGTVGIDFTNATQQFYTVASKPPGQSTNPLLNSGDDWVATFLQRGWDSSIGLLTPTGTVGLTLPAGTTSATIRLDVNPVLLQIKTLLAAIGIVGIERDAAFNALLDSKDAWNCISNVANAPGSIEPGSAFDFSRTLEGLGQCGLSAAEKAIGDRKLMLHRIGVALSLATTLPDQFFANIAGAIGELRGKNHLTFTLTGETPTPTTSTANLDPTIDRVDVSTWAYDRVEGDTYEADNIGSKKIEVFWKSFAGDKQVRDGCKSTVQLEGPGTSETKEVSGCDSYNPGSYLNARNPGTYTVTVTVHQNGHPDITAQRTVTVIPKGSR